MLISTLNTYFESQCVACTSGLSVTRLWTVKHIKSVSAREKTQHFWTIWKQLRCSKRRCHCGRVMLPNACHEAQQWTLQAKMPTAHLTKLQGKFHDYFQEKHRDDDWVCDPFTIYMESVLLPSHKQSHSHAIRCWKRNSLKWVSPSFSLVSLLNCLCFTVCKESRSWPSLEPIKVVRLWIWIQQFFERIL